MRYILLISLALFGCRHERKDTVDLWKSALDKKAFYLENAGDIYKTRCDKLTFRALAAAFGREENLAEHEYAPGEWHRDKSPCYPADSKSEISRDGFLGLFHSLWTQRDAQALTRIDDYGSLHGWRMGEGPVDLVSLVPLIPLLGLMRSQMAVGEADAIPALEGHRGHLIALYIHLRGRINGSIGPLEKETLDKLAADYPESPYYQALVHAYSDGDQGQALDILEKDFSDDQVPYDEGRYGWGSAPAVVYYLLVMGVLEGI